MDSISKNLLKTEVYRRDMEMMHSPMEEEMRFYDSVKRGDLETFTETYQKLGGEGTGVLSNDPIQNLKYHFVISIAFVTRFCVEGGMEREEAFNLSDLYIQKVDLLKDAEKINRLHYQAMRDYTERMHKKSKQNVYPRAIVRTIEFISNNLHRNFKVQEIADQLELSVPYLSTLFHRETGQTIVGYTRKRRIETAKRMLMYTDMHPADIAQQLAFSTHSHFIASFKELTGYTPRQYRDVNYRKIDAMKGGVMFTEENESK